MSEPIIPAGEFILGKSLQIFWCTEYSNQKGNITCWCLCFSRFNLKEERKVIKQGNQAYTITLPIKWIRNNHIEAGDEINLNKKFQIFLFSI